VDGLGLRGQGHVAQTHHATGVLPSNLRR
jgi:hypothetical protein